MKLDVPPMEDEEREVIEELQCGKSAGTNDSQLESFKADTEVH